MSYDIPAYLARSGYVDSDEAQLHRLESAELKAVRCLLIEATTAGCRATAPRSHRGLQHCFGSLRPR